MRKMMMRHACAALAVGWYLFVPVHGTWFQTHAYDTAAECESAKKAAIKGWEAWLDSPADARARNGEHVNPREAVTAMELSLCRASDDQRYLPLVGQWQ